MDESCQEPESPFEPLRLVMDSGRAIELRTADVVVGRHSEADVRLPLPDVSRRHCRFVYRDGLWQVRDLQSLNGLFVNDRSVTEVSLAPGDRLRIGSVTFTVELPGAARAVDDAASLLRRLVQDIAQPSSRLRRRSA